MENNNPITVKVTIAAPVEKVWQCWNEPAHITQWAFASDDWECPAAQNDLRVGGTARTTMAAKDNSASFDLVSTYTEVKENELIEYDMDDKRHVKIEFISQGDTTEVIETFDPEQENTEELQRSGWQAILDNFKAHVEMSH
jgi:uncharacterized protein YndB with AHSA1/START domain